MQSSLFLLLIFNSYNLLFVYCFNLKYIFLELISSVFVVQLKIIIAAFSNNYSHSHNIEIGVLAKIILICLITGLHLNENSILH
jgi:hypothetical protein